MKGQSNQERQALSLEGQGLARKVHLARAAVENWARFSEGPADLHDARFKLLEEISAHGEFSAGHPSWMTSPKPGVEAYIHLPGNLSLVLVKDPNGTAERPYLASNCLAPRRGSKKKETKGRGPLQKARLEGEKLQKALNLSAQELGEKTRLTQHLKERFLERVGQELDYEGLRELLTQGHLKPKAPEWADMAGYGGPCLELSYQNHQLAFPVVPDNLKEDGYVITTVLDKDWVERDLLALKGEELFSKVHFTSEAIKAMEEHQVVMADLKALAAGSSLELNGGTYIRLGNYRVRLLPGSHGRGQHKWLARSFETIEPNRS